MLDFPKHPFNSSQARRHVETHGPLPILKSRTWRARLTETYGLLGRQSNPIPIFKTTQADLVQCTTDLEIPFGMERPVTAERRAAAINVASRRVEKIMHVERIRKPPDRL